MAVAVKRVSNEKESEERVFKWVGTRAVRPDGVDKVTAGQSLEPISICQICW